MLKEKFEIILRAAKKQIQSKLEELIRAIQQKQK